jgi:hypothetical protein
VQSARLTQQEESAQPATRINDSGKNKAARVEMKEMDSAAFLPLPVSRKDCAQPMRAHTLTPGLLFRHVATANTVPPIGRFTNQTGQ